MFCPFKVVLQTQFPTIRKEGPIRTMATSHHITVDINREAILFRLNDSSASTMFATRAGTSSWNEATRTERREDFNRCSGKTP